ncbi:uncharacterized protein BO97DRAFT_131765 [Aspergillus homomorphus CBS 101889]|uniref:Uncharacterized protein n=1 Tax=Aspergillus homomorphus (strain CBS 101889) TaxID=1450537 RepID=A0A395I808_ASPHC|nr:hypothetical protein BO97DRAFT_131765 [Aspergillus homomorphus CBS 101889]RAL16362.1 hypothetical protein BO97DRAFT_131765 [Aspergillus homomorphus CBS 101889]
MDLLSHPEPRRPIPSLQHWGTISPDAPGLRQRRRNKLIYLGSPGGPGSGSCGIIQCLMVYSIYLSHPTLVDPWFLRRFFGGNRRADRR